MFKLTLCFTGEKEIFLGFISAFFAVLGSYKDNTCDLVKFFKMMEDFENGTIEKFYDEKNGILLERVEGN